MNEYEVVRAKDWDSNNGLIETLKEVELTFFKGIGYIIDEGEVFQIKESLKETTWFILKHKIIIGILSGSVTKFIGGSEPIFQQYIWYVRRSERRYGVNLYREMIKYCKRNKISKLIMTAISNNEFYKMNNFFLSEDFKPIETHYFKEI